MCGRKTLTKGKLEIIENLLIDEWEEGYEFAGSYNVAPTQQHPVMIGQEGRRIVKGMHWGLIPSWAKKDAPLPQMINARIETLEEKVSFRSTLNRGRCVIIADGWYEWKKDSSGRQPYYIFREGHELLTMAGLYNVRSVGSGHKLFTYTIITREAEGVAAEVHHRMPFLLDSKLIPDWIDTENIRWEKIRAEMNCDLDKLKNYPVSNMVNMVRNNNPALIKPFHHLENMELFPDLKA